MDEALTHGGIDNNLKVNLIRIESDYLKPNDIKKKLGKEKEETKQEGEVGAVAAIGSSVIVKNLAKETEHNFQLVNPDEADPKTGKLPLTNPIAKALEGSKEGDEVSVGPNTFKVIKLN